MLFKDANPNFKATLFRYTGRDDSRIIVGVKRTRTG
jgi:hypothetical protein